MSIFVPDFRSTRREDIAQRGQEDFLYRLVAAGMLTADAAHAAQTIAKAENLNLREVMQSRFGVSPLSLVLAESGDLAARIIDPARHPPDPALVMRVGPARCLSYGLLPWRRVGEFTLVLCHNYDHFQSHQSALEDLLGPVRMALSTSDQMTNVLARTFKADLVHRAENRLADAESSRGRHAGRAMWLTTVIALGLLALTLIAPIVVLTALSALAVSLLVLTGAVKTAAALSGFLVPAAVGVTESPLTLPIITLLIPLYREKAIAEHLLTRLEALDYPPGQSRLASCFCQAIENTA